MGSVGDLRGIYHLLCGTSNVENDRSCGIFLRNVDPLAILYLLLLASGYCPSTTSNPNILVLLLLLGLISGTALNSYILV